MFCTSCGKKITNKSIFCKYCGANQIEEEKIIQKFPFNSSPKKAWVFLWITTMLVFVVSLFISVKFEDIKITLLSREALLILFLTNIFLGIFSFFVMAFSRSHTKNNKTYKFIKYIFFICLVYLVINPSIFAVEGYKAKQNPEYKNKYYSGPVTPTPIPPDFKNKLLEEINKYRSEQKIGTLNTDDESCKVAERLIKKPDLKGDIAKVDYIDLCPSCDSVGFVWIDNTSPDNAILKFKESDNTKAIINDKKFKYGCGAIDNQRILFFLSNKNIQSKKSTVNIVNQNNVECIGPDGKQFNTSMNECKKLNEKWGKPVDYIVDCGISQTCGGGSKKLKLSECNNSTCCQIGSNWIFYTSVSKCKSDQGGSSNGNNNPPPAPSAQNNSAKVAFQATETTIKGTYYCYDNKVNEMVTQQSFVKSQRELYELCKSSSSRQSVYNQCWGETCNGLVDRSSCSSACYDKAYSDCSNYYKTYSEYQSKLNTMRWQNCP